MIHGIPQTRADIVRLLTVGQGIAEDMLAVWDALAHLSQRTLCVIKFGQPRQRVMQFIGMFPGDSCEQIDRRLAALLAAAHGTRGVDWVLTVLNNDD